MASPILRLFDSGGSEVVAPIVFGSASPGVPTAEQTFTVRNNDAGGAPVDTALGVYVVVTARVAGSSDAFVSLGNAFADAAAAQARVISFTGGSTGNTTGFRRSPLRVGEIPDGAQTEIGIRIVATAASATSDWEARITLETNPWIPLRDVGFETVGNWVYDGRGGGFAADPDFTAIETVTGSFAAGAADDTIDLPTLVRYYLEGLVLAWEPSPATLTFTNLDGAAAALASGEAYYAGLSLDSAGALTTTKGSKDTAPLTDADKPALPADELAMVWVVVPFGLAIDTIEQIYELGFFQEEQTGGLGLTIHPGFGASAGYWSRIETAVEVTLADDEVSTTWLLPGNALEVTVAASTYASERRALPLWRHTTAAGAITVTEDLRQIGADVRSLDVFQATFVVGTPAAGAVTVAVQIEDRHGQAIAYAASVEWYLADDAAGLTPTATAPNGGVAAGTDGALIEHTADLSGRMISETDGDVDVVVTHSVSAVSYYLVAAIGGRLYPSAVITPTP